MSTWRYCSCGAGQDQIEIADLETISYDEFAKVECSQCGGSRDDDTPELRIMVLLQAIAELRGAVEALKPTPTALPVFIT